MSHHAEGGCDDGEGAVVTMLPHAGGGAGGRGCLLLLLLQPVLGETSQDKTRQDKSTVCIKRQEHSVHYPSLVPGVRVSRCLMSGSWCHTIPLLTSPRPAPGLPGLCCSYKELKITSGN